MGGYDSVIVATGSMADKSGFSPVFSAQSCIPGIEGNPIVCTIDEIVSGKTRAGRKVVVYDDQGDIKGVSLAEMVAEDGRDVEVISRLNMLGQFVDVMTRIAAQIRAFTKNVRFTPDNVIKSVNEKELTLLNIYNNLESKRVGVDTLMLITWRYPNRSLYDSVYAQFKGPMYAIGDAASPRTIEEAVYDGHRVGREV